MTRPLFHTTPEQALLPEALPHHRNLEERRRLHQYVLNVRSSQAFAPNLFAPLDGRAATRLLRHLGLPAVAADTTEFEYEDPDDALGEASARSRHRTQVDAVLRGRDEKGRDLVALIEVKLTETDFSGCSAYANPENPRRDVCHTEGLFGSDPAGCFQLNNHGHGRRRYHDHLGALPVNLLTPPNTDGGCLVRTSLNQPMRNLALAHMLLDTGQAHRVVYALTAPCGHRAIWRRFAQLQQAFPDTPTRQIARLPAEDVAALHPDQGSALRRLYPHPVLSQPTTSTAPALAHLPHPRAGDCPESG